MSLAGEAQRSHLFASLAMLSARAHAGGPMEPQHNVLWSSHMSMLSGIEPTSAVETCRDTAAAAVCSIAKDGSHQLSSSIPAMDGAMQLSSTSLPVERDQRDTHWLRIPSGWEACMLCCSAATGTVGEVGGPGTGLRFSSGHPQGASTGVWGSACLEPADRLDEAGCLSAEAQLMGCPSQGAMCRVLGLDLRPVVPVRTHGASPIAGLMTPRTPRCVWPPADAQKLHSPQCLMRLQHRSIKGCVVALLCLTRSKHCCL